MTDIVNGTQTEEQAHKEYRKRLRKLAHAVNLALNGNAKEEEMTAGYVLIIVPLSDNPDEPRYNMLTNMERTSSITALTRVSMNEVDKAHAEARAAREAAEQETQQ